MTQKGGFSCSFAPELLDIIIPQDQAQQGSDLQDIFLVMTFQESSLARLISNGS